MYILIFYLESVTASKCVRLRSDGEKRHDRQDPVGLQRLGDRAQALVRHARLAKEAHRAVAHPPAGRGRLKWGQVELYHFWRFFIAF